MSQKSCPISFVQVDTNLVRINSTFMALLLMAYLLSGEAYILYFLIADMASRMFFGQNYSLLSNLAIFFQNVFNIQNRFSDAAPKKLASYFGFTFLITIAALHLFSFNSAMYIVSAILLACLFLEVLFSYCLGCEIYHLYKRFTL
ncbi:DUF4395 domain-containing protein [Sulfurimonas sp.]